MWSCISSNALADFRMKSGFLMPIQTIAVNVNTITATGIRSTISIAFVFMDNPLLRRFFIESLSLPFVTISV